MKPLQGRTGGSATVPDVYRQHWPANQGIGFQVRGTGVFHHLFGTLASPETHGNYGAGSTMFWVDPVADVSFALVSAGVMTQAANIERCQKLSDLTLSAMI